MKYLFRGIYATLMLYGGIGFLSAYFVGHGLETRWLIASFIIAAILTTYGYNIGTHYAFTHRVFKFPRVIEIGLIYISTLAAVASPISWAANHYAHHKYTETIYDPHSPQHLGVRALFFTAYKTPKIELAGFRHLITNPWHRFADGHFGFWLITLSWPVAAWFYAAWKGLVYLWLVPLVYVLSVALLFVFAHGGKWDQRSGSRAINSRFLNLVSFGDGDHKAHHRNMKHCGATIRFFAALVGAR